METNVSSLVRQLSNCLIFRWQIPLALVVALDDPQAAWDQSDDARAMACVLTRIDRRIAIACACACVRLALHEANVEGVPLRAIEACEAWLCGRGDADSALVAAGECWTASEYGSNSKMISPKEQYLGQASAWAGLAIAVITGKDIPEAKTPIFGLRALDSADYAIDAACVALVELQHGLEYWESSEKYLEATAAQAARMTPIIHGIAPNIQAVIAESRRERGLDG